MTTTAMILTTQRIVAAEPPPTTNAYAFTLVFPSGLVAVLEVCGAADQDRARAIAELSVRHRQTINVHGDQIETPVNYIVMDGDGSGGRAACVCSWICVAQEVTA
jgi:hypothetical protein